MHQDDLPVSDDLIRQLLSEQAPHWASLPLRRLDSSGTDNALYRLGDHLLLRLPRRASAALMLAKELDWLPRLGDLPLKTPKLRFRGQVDLGLNCAFGILEWMEGVVASPANIADHTEAASCLAGFLKALQLKPTDGAPPAGALNNRRGVPLSQMSDVALPAIDALSDEVDTRAARESWEAAISETRSVPPVWLHGDLKADNLIAVDGQLSGVIDWGLAAVGDPAADHAAAWTWVDPVARRTFRDCLAIDDGDWLRAKGWALYGAVIALSYYRGGRNDSLCQQSRLTLSRLGLLL